MSRLRIAPVTLGQARAHVERLHSHLHAPLGGLCAVGVEARYPSSRGDGWALACVAILSRPVARRLQEQGCAEVVRCASDGTPDASSMAYGAIRRAALALGWRRIVTSTLLGEAGTCLRAAGWRPVAVGEAEQFQWDNRAGRALPAQPGAKVRWETGPDALLLDPEVDALVRASVGKVAILPRGESLPLFSEAAR